MNQTKQVGFAPARRVEALNRKRPVLCYVLAYTLLCAALGAVWAGYFVLNGKAALDNGDCYQQHFLALVYYGRWLRTVLRTVFVQHSLALPLWDLSIGYGSDVLTTFSYYTLGDPLNLLSVLVPSQKTELLYQALMALRLYLAGLSFSAYSLARRNSRFGTLLGSLSYVFCVYALWNTVGQPNFINPMIYMPLVLLGVDRVFDGKSPLLFIVSVGLAALCNFYFFYMIGLLMVLYAIFVYLCRYGVKNPLQALPLVGRFAGYTLVGTLLAGVLLFPSLAALFASSRVGGVHSVPLFYPLRDMWQTLANLGSSAQDGVYWTYSGTTVTALLAVGVLFSRKKQDAAYKIGWLLLLAFLLLPFAGSLFNGLSYASNRWEWGFILLESIILARQAPAMESLTQAEKHRLALLLAGFGAVCFAHYLVGGREPVHCMEAFALLALLVLWLQVGRVTRRRMQAVLLAATCGGTLLNLGAVFSTQSSGNITSGCLDAGTAYDRAVTANGMNAVAQLGDGDLYRADGNVPSLRNSSMLLGLDGLRYYFSLNNSAVTQFYTQLEYNDIYSNSYGGWEGRSIPELLMGTRYYVTAEQEGDTAPAAYRASQPTIHRVGEEYYEVRRAEDALPLGFTCDSVIDPETYEGLTVSQKEEALLQGAVAQGTALPAAELTFESSTLKAETATYNLTVSGTDCYTVSGLPDAAGDESGYITLTFPQGGPAGEYYLVLEGLSVQTDNPYRLPPDTRAEPDSPARRLERMSKRLSWRRDPFDIIWLTTDQGDDIKYACYNETYNYYSGRDSFAVPLGWRESGPGRLQIQLPAAGTYTLRASVQCQPLTALHDRVENLTADSLQDVTVEGGRVTGRITLDTAKMLVMQLPYSAGWSATVDGAPAPILQTDTMFLGLELAPGTHEICFVYRTPGLTAGLAATGAGLAALVGLALWSARKKRRKTPC